MEGPSVAHELPELYRAVLDRVASLEALGQRPDAEAIRRDAVRAYSRAWDERARRRLTQLRTRAERLLDAAGRTRGPLSERLVGRPDPA